MTACMIGWHHSKFGKLEGEDVESLVVDVATKALKDAEMDPRDIDAIYLGFYNGGFSAQDFGSSLVMNGVEGLRWKPATRVENACATGSAAIHQGINFIEAKQGRNVLVIGVEKMTDTPGQRLARSFCQLPTLRKKLKPKVVLPVSLARLPATISRNWRSVRCAGDHCGEEPQERRQQPIGTMPKIWVMTSAGMSLTKTRWLRGL